MKTRILFLVAALFLMGEVPASAQNNFLKKVGKSVLNEVKKSLNNSSSNKSSNSRNSSGNTGSTEEEARNAALQKQWEAVVPKEDLPGAKKYGGESKPVARPVYPVTENTCTNPFVLDDKSSSYVYLVADDLVYCVNPKDCTGWMESVTDEAKGSLESVRIYESIMYNNEVYLINMIGGRRGALNGEPITSLTIPPTIKILGGLSGTMIDSLRVPGTVESVKNGCFANSWAQKIVIEEGVKDIGGVAFQNCTKLKEAYLPSTIEKVDREWFRGCTALTKVHLPDNLKIIPIGTFNSCKSLATVEIPETVGEIRAYAFAYSGLKKVTIPAGVKKIEESAFQECPLEEITIPSSVEEIGQWAFEGCKKLKKVTISRKFKDIRKIVEIFGNDLPYLLTSADLDQCKGFVWTD